MNEILKQAITTRANKGIAKWSSDNPAIAQRIERALWIALGKQWDYLGTDFWAIHGYTVTETTCTCPDVTHLAPVLNDRKLCKHQIAAALIRRSYEEIGQDVPITDEDPQPVRQVERHNVWTEAQQTAIRVHAARQGFAMM